MKRTIRAVLSIMLVCAALLSCAGGETVPIEPSASEASVTKAPVTEAPVTEAPVTEAPEKAYEPFVFKPKVCSVYM